MSDIEPLVRSSYLWRERGENISIHSVTISTEPERFPSWSPRVLHDESALCFNYG